jgi:5-formyltetrahydrofolate cyclo-ligase
LLDHQLDKQQLRLNLLKVRKSMSVEEWRTHSMSICAHLLGSSLFTEAKTILAYFSFRQEAELSPLFADKKHRWGFPRCVGDCLSWHYVEKFDDNSLVPGAYGITEPHANTPKITATEVDLIIVPCVACDYQGYRLGYGGGYYDRFLASPDWANKTTIGITFDFAFLPQIPIESWDKSLQNICTETGFKFVS